MRHMLGTPLYSSGPPLWVLLVYLWLVGLVLGVLAGIAL